MRFEGSRTYGGQYALLQWRMEDGGWLPTVRVTQFVGDGTGNWHTETVDMKAPPAVNRDGTPRSEAAKRFALIGTWYSDALQARITTGREIKAMRAQDIAAKEALAEKLRRGRKAA